MQWQEVLWSSLAIYGVGNLSRSATNDFINEEDTLVEFCTIDKPYLIYIIYLKNSRTAKGYSKSILLLIIWETSSLALE